MTAERSGPFEDSFFGVCLPLQPISCDLSVILHQSLAGDQRFADYSGKQQDKIGGLSAAGSKSGKGNRYST